MSIIGTIIENSANISGLIDAILTIIMALIKKKGIHLAGK